MMRNFLVTKHLKVKKLLCKEDDTVNKENIMPLSGNLRITLIVAGIYIQQLILPEKQTILQSNASTAIAGLQ